MTKRTLKKGAAVLLALMISINSTAGYSLVSGITAYADERPAQVKATTLNVRSGPGTSYSIVTKLNNGTSVTVIGETTGSDGMVWYQIRFSGSTGAETTGYARSDYIRFPANYTTEVDFENYLNSQGFPESYKPGLRQLHAMYPSWVFTAQHTNLDWNTVIENEALVGRNLIYSSSISSWKSTADGAYNWETSTWPAFDSGNYVAASDALIRYYMDPRNFLDDIYVFQFLLHSYDASAHTADGLRSMVSGTFLSGSAAVSGEMGSSSPSGSTGSYGPGSYTGGGGPGVTGGTNSNVSTQGPGSGNVSSGTGAGSPGAGTGSSGVSTQAPGASNVSGSGTNSNVSTQAPGASNVSGSGTNSNVSTQAPGASNVSGSGTNSNVSRQAPGASGVTGGTNSNVSRQAPGSVASAAGTGIGGRMFGAASGVFDSRLILMTVVSGMTSGPGANTNSVPGSSAGPGVSGPGSSLSGPSGTGGSSSGAPTADYVDIIMNAGIQSGVNPYVLAAMILQEQGNDGTGRSISGTVSGYAGYYNFFNVEAYQSGNMDAVTRGLWYASQSGSYNRPWNSVDKSIIGGALHYGTNYVKVGQDTFYLKKFNVQGQNIYKHQYMTNVQAAASEGAKLAEAYGDTLKRTALEFKIPVYLNMPQTACGKPTVDGSPNNKLSGLSVDGFALTPTFNRDTTTYDLIVDSSVAQVQVNASAYSSAATISGAGAVNLQSGINEIVISVRAQNGDVRQYVIRVVRQQNGPTHNSALSSGTGSAPGAVSGGPGSAQGNMSSGPGAIGGSGPGMSSEGPGAAGSSPGGGAAFGNGPGGSNVTIVQ